MCIRVLWVLALALVVTRAEPLLKDAGDADQPLRRIRRIIGGEYVQQSYFPFIVSIQAKLNKDVFATLVGGVEHFCGGTLIGQRWILTAAHCLYAYDKANRRIPLFDPSLWHVRMGTGELRPTILDRLKGSFTRLFNFFYGQRKLQTFYHIEKIILHPNYHEPTLEYDVALLKVREYIQPSSLKEVEILRLPYPAIVGPNWPPPNQMCTALGWGCSCLGCLPEMNLKAVHLPVISASDCRNIFRVPINLTESTEFCAGYVNGSKGICSGDSGGPLVCEFGGTPMIAGVISAIHGRFPDRFPAVFSRASAYTEWITDTMRCN
ncbi:hypothetical protein Aperf_G00000062339 [Anoplocephala perfoliata]